MLRAWRSLSYSLKTTLDSRSKDIEDGLEPYCDLFCLPRGMMTVDSFRYRFGLIERCCVGAGISLGCLNKNCMLPQIYMKCNIYYVLLVLSFGISFDMIPMRCCIEEYFGKWLV